MVKFLHLTKNFRSDEPGVCRLVRTAYKCFAEGSGGDEKAGVKGNLKRT